MHTHTYTHLVTLLEPKGQRPCVFFLCLSVSHMHAHTGSRCVYFLSRTEQACINIWAASQRERGQTPTWFKIIDWSKVLIGTCASCFPHWIKVHFGKRNICKRAGELFILKDLRWKCFIGVSRWKQPAALDGWANIIYTLRHRFQHSQ